jgi:hypothetical protein
MASVGCALDPHASWAAGWLFAACNLALCVPVAAATDAYTRALYTRCRASKALAGGREAAAGGGEEAGGSGKAA